MYTMAGQEDKVVQIPLPDRRDRIAFLLARDATNREEWIEIKLGLIREFGAARKELLNEAFNEWFESLDSRINRNTRDAYVSMARDLDLARKVLNATTSKSIELINRKEFRPLFDTTLQPGERSTIRHSVARSHPKQNKAAEIIDKMEATGEKITTATVAAKAGIGNTLAKKVIAIHRGTKEAVASAVSDTVTTLTEDQALAAASFSEKSKLTIADAIRIHKERLDKAFHAQVQAEVRRIIDRADDHVRKRLKEVEAQYEAVSRMLRQKGVFTRLEFRQLQMAVHPDNTASVEVRNRLLDLLVKNEARLLKE